MILGKPTSKGVERCSFQPTRSNFSSCPCWILIFLIFISTFRAVKPFKQQMIRCFPWSIIWYLRCCFLPNLFFLSLLCWPWPTLLPRFPHCSILPNKFPIYVYCFWVIGQVTRSKLSTHLKGYIASRMRLINIPK